MKFNKNMTAAVFMLVAGTVNAQILENNSGMKENNNNLQDASRIGRTSGSKAPEFQELYEYEAEDTSLVEAMFPYQSYLHRAYVVMLYQQHILNKKEAKKILNGLDKVDELAKTNPALKVYMPYEAALINEIGPLGGKMHIGRSRNDLDNTTNRMFLRAQLLKVIQSVSSLRKVLLESASQNVNTVMIVYTHRKEAQPITYAHYLTAIDESLAKSQQRFISLYSRINQSPLGSGATGGTSWPLDRRGVADLLGFDNIVNNTIEGTAGWDHIAEFAADNAIYMSSLSRLASEVQLWSSDEYRMVEIDNAFAGISSMMPQKKNPDALERSRKASNLVLGQLVAVVSSLNAIEYQHSGVRYPIDPKSINAVLASTHAMTGLMRTLHLNKEVMMQYARENFSTMTDLADLLVRESGIDFREAHEVIATVVNEAIAKNKKADKITLSIVKAAAKKQLKIDLEITEKQFKEAIDPWHSILRKTGDGMPSPTSVEKMITLSSQDNRKNIEWINKKQEHLKNSSRKLQNLIDQL